MYDTKTFKHAIYIRMPIKADKKLRIQQYYEYTFFSISFFIYMKCQMLKVYSLHIKEPDNVFRGRILP